MAEVVSSRTMTKHLQGFASQWAASHMKIWSLDLEQPGKLPPPPLAGAG